MLQDNGHIVSGTPSQQFTPKNQTLTEATVEHSLIQKLDFYYKNWLKHPTATAHYHLILVCVKKQHPRQCLGPGRVCTKQGLAQHTEKVEASLFGQSMQLMKGKESVEMRTGDTVPLSLGGGTQTLAQRDVDHELHAEYAMSGCSTMG